MSKYKLNFKLKQHTPIIHFQYDQSGATLRASELKPKLDKFLIEKLGLTQTIVVDRKEKIVPKNEFKKWFINEGKNHLALDYKVRVVNEDEIHNIKMHIPDRPDRRGKWSSSFPNFFANMGKDSKEELINFQMFKKVVVSFSVFNINKVSNKFLINTIKENFPEFIAITNFGTRQSKGFGSYYIDKDDENYKEIDQTWFDYKSNVSISEKSEFKKVEQVFTKIEWFYKALRSGINYKKPEFIYENGIRRIKEDENGVGIMNSIFYMKPIIFLYFLNKKVQWEKKTIKQKYFNRDLIINDKTKYYGLITQKKKYENADEFKSFDNQKIIKDLLGLSSEESWLSYKALITKTESKMDGNNVALNNDNTPIDIEAKNKTIERYKSPITFVPYKKNEKEFDLYLKFNEDDNIKGKWFNIRNTKYQDKKPFALQVAEDFNLTSFFDFFVNSNFNISNYYKVYNEKTSEDIVNAINEVFSNLIKTT